MASNVSETDTLALKLSELVILPDKRIVKIKVRSADEISLDEDDPQHTVHIGECKCQVKGSSTVSFVAVKSTKRADLPPHFGVMVKNTFSLSGSELEKTEEYPYLLGCAEFFKKKVEQPSSDQQDQKPATSSTKAENVTLATMYVFAFCKDRAAVFEDIRSLHSTYEGANEIQSDEAKSNLSLPDLIKPVLAELRKPFDMDWSKHHLDPQGSKRTDEKMTNCAICASRMFVTLAANEEKETALMGVGNVFGQLGLKDMATKYRKDLTGSNM